MTKIIGILNLTPDSFSDGGTVTDGAARVAQLLEAGADMVDIGAESTRPGATPLSAEEEWARLEGVLGAVVPPPAPPLSPPLAGGTKGGDGGRLGGGLPQTLYSESAPTLTLPQGGRGLQRLSIDTRHGETARQALALGAGIINDVGGLRDAAMRAVLADADCDIIVMHALTIPVDKQVMLPKECDPVQVILEWKQEVIALAEASGIAQNRLIFDPGIGFGKTSEQSLALILRAGELVKSGGRWLYGHSRKSFLTLFSDAPPAARDALTLAFSAQLAEAGVQYLRVHDVAGHRTLLNMLSEGAIPADAVIARSQEQPKAVADDEAIHL